MHILHLAENAYDEPMTGPMAVRELQKHIEEIFDYAYAHSKIKIPAATCREVGKILHTGMYIEEVKKKIPAFSFSKEELANLSGTSNRFSTKMAGGLRKRFKEMNRRWRIYDESIIFENKEIAYICGRLNGIHISSPDIDVFGDALEIFRSQWAKQEGGQFFTDQRVTSLALTMLAFNPDKGDDLVDICAGTGGFLLAAFNRIKKSVEERRGQEGEAVKLAAKSLKGIEIDGDVCRLGNATLAARTGRYGRELIRRADSLDGQVFKRPGSRVQYNRHTCAATNPPFGAKINIKDKDILSRYELARLSNANVEVPGKRLYARAPDILFIEQNLKLLKPGTGRLAIVIPYQILSGPQAYYIRHWLLRNAIVEAVVDLPNETFQPHTGTKTCLLVLRRHKAPLLSLNQVEDSKIFMSLPEWIGHDRRGNPIYKRGASGKITGEILTDFPEVEKAFFQFKNGKKIAGMHANSFTINAKSILSDPLLRMNAHYHRPSPSGCTVSASATWRILKIDEVIKDIFCPGRFKRDYVEESDNAVPFLGGSNITELIVQTDKWLRHNDPHLSKLRVRQGWLLVTRSGTTGIVSSVPLAWDGYAISEHVIRIIPDESRLDPMYLYAFLRTKICQAEMARGVFGSVIDEITPETIKNINLPVPLDATILAKICKKMRDAEKARQEAINNTHEAVDDLEDIWRIASSKKPSSEAA